MKKLNTLLLFSILAMTGLSAQVIISPVFRASEVFYVDQIFHVMITNAGPGEVNGYLQVVIESRDHQPVVKAGSSVVRLMPGAVLNGHELGWGNDLLYGNNTFSTSLRQTGKLPAGEYIFCYYFYRAATNELLEVDCQEKYLEGFGPPELLFPPDNGVVSEYPVLTWKPPITLSFLDFNYYLRLVRLEDGQSSIQGIKSNFPLVEVRNLTEPFLLYPSTASQLKSGENYAWQVEAFSQNGVSMGKTEIWKFRLEEEKVKEDNPAPPESYRFVKTVLDGSYYSNFGTLYFAYDNRFSERKLHYTIYQKDGTRQQVVNLPEISLKSGINRLSIDCEKIKMLEDEIYILEIKDNRGKKFYLEFKYLPGQENG